MARLDVNRSAEMEVYVAVVEQGGFSAAARALSLTPSAVSKLISRLESRLNVRLINRSTRQFRLTPEGREFYERSASILASIEDAERAAASAVEAVGRIRLNTSSVYLAHRLNPLLPQFLARFPGVTLDIAQTDTVVDLMADHTDIAVRTGPLKSSSLIARKLGETRLTVAASPAYLERHGTPLHPNELSGTIFSDSAIAVVSATGRSAREISKSPSPHPVACRSMMAKACVNWRWRD